MLYWVYTAFELIKHYMYHKHLYVKPKPLRIDPEKTCMHTYAYYIIVYVKISYSNLSR